ncbi:MAG: hypothetical protein ISR77_28960 [Pirellulaceae bacterium]|nr:hypothetical protein [Pirellulaceae bacterium]
MPGHLDTLGSRTHQRDAEGRPDTADWAWWQRRPENTILLTEITNSKVPWLQPRDIDSRSTSMINDPDALSISSAPWRRPYVVFGDQIRAYGVRRNIPPDALKALTTIAGREPITRSRLLNQGHLE